MVIENDWGYRMQSKMTPAGLEPAIPGSVGRCLIHWATGPDVLPIEYVLCNGFGMRTSANSKSIPLPIFPAPFPSPT